MSATKKLALAVLSFVLLTAQGYIVPGRPSAAASDFPALDALDAAGKIDACWLADDEAVGALGTWEDHYGGGRDITGSGPTVQESADHSRREVLSDADDENGTFTATDYTGTFAITVAYTTADIGVGGGEDNTIISGNVGNDDNFGYNNAGTGGTCRFNDVNCTIVSTGYNCKTAWCVITMGRNASDEIVWWSNGSDITPATPDTSTANFLTGEFLRDSTSTGKGRYGILCLHNALPTDGEIGNIHSEIDTYYDGIIP